MKNKISFELKHVQERLNQLKSQDMVARPPRGWIRFIRKALNMSSKALAKRVGVSANTMSETEKAEFEEGITIRRLQKVANAMDCDLVYYFLPRRPIADMIETRAKYMAEQKVRNDYAKKMNRGDALSNDQIEQSFDHETDKFKSSKKLWD